MSSTTTNLVGFNTALERIRLITNKILKRETIPSIEWITRVCDVVTLILIYPEPFKEIFYNKIKNLLDEHVESISLSICLAEPKDILHVYFEKFLEFLGTFSDLNKLFKPLNELFVRKYNYDPHPLRYAGQFLVKEQLLNTSNLCYYLWEKNVILPLKVPLVSQLLAAIEDDRSGKREKQFLVKKVLLTFVFYGSLQPENSFYLEIFVKPLVEITREYYLAKANELRAKGEDSMYMDKVLQFRQSERSFFSRILPACALKEALLEIEACMIQVFVLDLNATCVVVVEEENPDNLYKLYELVKTIQSEKNKLIEQMELKIKKKGVEKLNNLDPSHRNFVASFVEQVMLINKHYQLLLKDVFQQDEDFKSSIDTALIKIVNHKPRPDMSLSTVQIFVGYFEQVLQRLQINLDFQKFEEMTENLFNLFIHIDNKCEFQDTILTMLCARTIDQFPVFINIRDLLTNKFKALIGVNKMNRYERLFESIMASKNLNYIFWAEFPHGNQKCLCLYKYSHAIVVLEAFNCPLGRKIVSPCFLPHWFHCVKQEYEKFYRKKFRNRKLIWMHHLDNVELKLMFTDKSYTAMMNIFHAIIILLFENKDELTYNEIKNNTNLNNIQLSKHLQSFIDCGILLLTTHSNKLICENIDRSSLNAMEMPQAFPQHSRFALNLNFASEQEEFKLTVAKTQEAPEKERKFIRNEGSIEQECQANSQAAIVRIMKSHHQMNHNQLVERVMDQLKNRFKLTSTDIENAIKALIDKEYIELNQENADEYIYLS